MPASHCDFTNRPRPPERHRFGDVFPYCERPVAVRDLVEASFVSARRHFQILTLLRVALHVGSCVQNHVEGLRGLAHSHAREVLAASLAHTGRHRRGEVFESELRLGRVELRSVDAVEGELMFCVERVDSG
ncbi:hypothetical protein CR513_23668, partial [Mucuna pruriens]